jgi:hypothetical protein
VQRNTIYDAHFLVYAEFPDALVLILIHVIVLKLHYNFSTGCNADISGCRKHASPQYSSAF